MTESRDDRREAEQNKVHNPHDSFFHEMMREPRVFRAFIRKYLPTDIVRRLDLRTVKPTHTHFVDERLRHLYSDCLYRARTKSGEDTLLYFLVEHFSTPDYWSSFRLWQYVFAAWDDVIRGFEGKQGKLPLIVPVLVYNGPRKFDAARDLRDLIGGERALVDRIFLGPAHLVDLNEIEDDDLREESHLAVALLTLKHAFDRAMPCETLIVRLRDIENPALRRRFLLAMLRYIFTVRGDADPEHLERLVVRELGWQGDDVMTVAEKLRAEGREEGIRTTALGMLQKGIEKSLILEITGLSPRELQKLELEFT